MFFRKIIRKIIFYYVKLKNFSEYMANVYSQFLVNDLFESEVPFNKKIWAYKRGFVSHRILDYGINDDNYQNYLSDYDYYRMHPLNGSESKWIDDKMTTKYVLTKFDEFLPEYYYILKKGKVIKLHNANINHEATISDVVNILEEKKMLALKKEAAYGGDGFYKATYLKNEKYFLNDKEYSKEELISFLSKLDDYLVTEYIVAHKDIRKYYDKSAGVLRVMVINESKPFIANAYLRVGSKKSGYIDAYTGSISSVVDIDHGFYGDAFMHNGISFIKLEVHPDSGIPFKGYVPKWDYVKQKLLEIAEYMPQLKYLGFDVCITESGFKIFEINSHQGIELFQLSYPLLKDNPASEFFKNNINKK